MQPADAIGPFRINVPEAALVGLCQRIAAIALPILADTLASIPHI